MANRWFQQFRYSLEKQIVDLYATMTFDGAGDALLDAANSKGIASVAHTGPGTFEITLQDTYYRFMMMDWVWTGQQPTAPDMYVVSETVNTLGSPVITVQMLDVAGAPADPALDDRLQMQFSLKNSGAF